MKKVIIYILIMLLRLMLDGEIVDRVSLARIIIEAQLVLEVQ